MILTFLNTVINKKNLFISKGKTVSEKIKNYFNKFKKIYYFGDYDNKGFQIYKILNNNIECKCDFITPKKNVLNNILNKMNSLIIKSKRNNDKYITNKELLTLLNKKDKILEMQQEVFI